MDYNRGMKRDQFTITDVTGQEGQKKLDHYNQWLLDPKREPGSIYPGYTGTNRKVTAVTVEKKTKRVYNKRIVTHTLKGNEMSKVTKLSIATDIVKANPEKAVALAAIMETLSVTKSNAFVYFTKAQKLIGGEKETGVKTEVKSTKSAKVSTKNTSKVTEISQEKHKEKVGEIDKVIASLKGVKATPFTGLVTGV